MTSTFPGLGTDIPADVESTTNAVFVVFHTDGGNAGLAAVASDPGFFLDWVSTHGTSSCL